LKLTRLVSATRLSKTSFWKESLLGRSLLAMPEAYRPELVIAFENRTGLPEIYNRALDACPDERNLLFVHDDVFLHDQFLQYRIAEGLSRYDVIGLAGSRGGDPNQPSWGLAFDADLKPTGWQKPDSVEMSGAVSHVSRYVDPATPKSLHPAPHLGGYGPMPMECDLLDGLFLACNAALLKGWKVRFDERFSFHLYDLDFCRSARAKFLRLGTWPILVSHGSAGHFESEAFRTAARTYLDKWNAPSVPSVPTSGKTADSRQQTADSFGGTSSNKQQAPDPSLQPAAYCSSLSEPQAPSPNPQVESARHP